MGARGESGSQRVRGIVLGLTVALGLATASAAQETQPTPQVPVAAKQPTAAKAEEQPKGGMGEGIKVHGHWTIDIKNPDGTLASHNEFENELADGGQALVSLLTGSTSGGWSISLSALLPGPSPCRGQDGGTDECLIIPMSFAPAGNAQFATLTATAQLGYPSAVVLKGSATALAAGEISRVSTSVAICTSSTTPASCSANFYRSAGYFTDVSLGLPGKPPVVRGVVAGQIMQVTVVISFS